MEDIILIGSGGCMREIAWQIQEQNKEGTVWNIIGYVDCERPENGIGVVVGTQIIPYLGDDDYLLNKKENIKAAVCVGEPKLREKIAKKLLKNSAIQFPNLVLSHTKICEDLKLGNGCIISMDARVSTNVVLGDFVFINTGSKICHDGYVEDFVTLSPDVTLAGNVKVGAFSDIGLGTKVIQEIQIGKNTVVGAGSIVVHDIEGNCTVAGVPARKIRG